VLTVLFTDIVGSTELAAELEDRRWRRLLAQHNSVVRRELRRFRGHEVDTAGDGFLATFEEPTAGVRCAWAIADAVRQLGLEVRAALHTGEVEIEDGKLSGIAVHTAARIVGYAGPGEVVTSATVRELSAGSGARFEDRGRRRLKGVPGAWRLFAVADVDGTVRSPAPSSDVAAERRARASELPPRRRRGVLAALAVLLLAGISAVVLLVVPRDEIAGPTPGGSLVGLDPGTGRVDQKVRLPIPIWRGLAAGEGGVWVVQQLPGRYAVAHLDPSTGKVVARVDLGEAAVPRDIVVGERAVWVLSSGPGLVDALISQVNPATDQLLRQSTVGREFTDDPAGMSIGEGAMWIVLKNGVVARLDPNTARVLAQKDPISSAAAIAAGEGFVWVIDELSDAVLKLQPSSIKVLSRIPMPGSADQIVVGEGSVWVLDRDSGSIVRVNPRTEVVDDPIRVGDEPTDLVAAFGSVWVVDRANGTVSRVDPATRSVTTIDVGGTPTSIAADAASEAIWVAGPEAPPQVF
jgi:streptogramin lyase